MDSPVTNGSSGHQQHTRATPGAARPFVAADFAGDGKKHLLLAASGSVATIKIPNILRALSKHDGLSIRLVLSESAQKFLGGQSVEQPAFETLLSIQNVDGIHVDEDEWDPPWQRGAGILHIELRRWSDLLVIAPLSANTMAKMTMGFADSLLLSVIRAWDTTGEIEGSKRKIMLVAIAMNTAMWHHPITKKQLTTLEQEWGVTEDGRGWIEVLRPVEKTLACGDAGTGAMREWTEIVVRVEQHLGLGSI